MQSKLKWTKEVRNAYARAYYQKNRDYYKAYKEQNKEELREYQKNYRLQRKAMESEKEIVEKAIKERKRSDKKNPDEIDLLYATRMELHKPLGIEILLLPFFKKLKEYKQENLMKYSEILGCTLPELREHIESQFEEGMNWKNIDIAKKNKTYHFKNLYPVWMQNK